MFGLLRQSVLVPQEQRPGTCLSKTFLEMAPAASGGGHMSNINELIGQLRRKGLSRASALGYHSGLFDEAADALEEIQSELEQVKRERDAAVEYLRGQCRYCKRNLVCTSRKGPHSNCWEWRGQKEE